MILAPNRQQLLSGNKLFAYLLLPLLLISCVAFKKTKKVEWPADEEIVEVKPEKVVEKSVIAKPKVDAKDEETLVYSTVLFKGEEFRVPQHKHNFDIAVLLPFHTDASNRSMDKRRADVMLEYYQGIKIAINQAQQLGSTFTVHFYDTYNDTSKLKTILKNPVMDKVDLILGPTSEDQVKIAAYFARERKIPLLSPFTTMSNLWSNNPYLFNLQPSDAMQAQVFLDYFKKYHGSEKLLIIRDGQSFDKSFGEALVAECNKQSINFTSVKYDQYAKWSNFLGPDKTVVLLTAKDKRKTKLDNVVTGLQSKAANVTLVGPEEWLDYANASYDQWQKVNITLMSTNKAQVMNYETKHVIENYRLNYNDDPSKYTFMGHDQMLFAFEALDAFGSHFPLFLEGKSIDYTNTTISLTKSATCFQNKFLQLYKLENNELRAVE
jgi:ABC-type branched-subunit amino acid transport system substrate-binding protein